MWTHYAVTLDFDGPFAAALPKTEDEIRAMLTHRMPLAKPDNAVPIEDLVAQVETEVGLPFAGSDTTEEWLPGWATFKRDAAGLYYEGRCVRAHLKDCANILAQGVFSDILNFRMKFVNRVYVVDRNIPIWRRDKDSGVLYQLREPDGTEQRFIQVMTRQGPRSSIKYLDYVESPTLHFVVAILDETTAEGESKKKGNEITVEHLRGVFEYGAMHGMGQERSQDWGRYAATVEAKPTERDMDWIRKHDPEIPHHSGKGDTQKTHSYTPGYVSVEPSCEVTWRGPEPRGLAH